MNGHLIDMRVLRQREIIELERRTHESQVECRRRVAQYEAQGAMVNEMSRQLTTMLGIQFSWMLAALLRAEMEKREQ